MREVAFLKQNADKWRRFEHQLARIELMTPDELSDIYVQITDDLSHCRTFYPHSKSTVYLNGLAVKVHQAIYRNKQEDSGRFIRFWKQEVPMSIAESFRPLMLSFAVFMASALIGVVSAAYDDSFVRVILGDDYVNMTLENIRRGEPMAVYASKGELDTFFAISYNNVMVSLKAYALGFLLGFGTLYIMMFNGIMVGSFQYFFFQHGVGLTSALTIWIHGTIEISTIIVAGAAGLTLGGGFLFPGTYTRGQSFLAAGRRSVKIILGIVPLIVLAAFLEGFVTRHSDVAPALSAAIIIASLSFVIWYFVLLPLRYRRQMREDHAVKIRDNAQTIVAVPALTGES